MSDVLFPAVCFGKLPSFGDFVRHNAASREVLAFDEWIHQGLYFARTQLGPKWDQTFAAAPQYHFLFIPENAERYLAGVMQASHDKSLRRYPFLVSLLLDRRRFTNGEAHLLPVALSDFFAGGRRFVDRAMNGIEAREIADQTLALNVPDLNHLVSTSAFKSEFLDRVTLSGFLTRLFDSFDNPRKYLVFKNLADVLPPFRSRSLLRLNLGLRFPLSADDGATSYEVCFWVYMCQAFLGATSFTPILFWTRPQSEKSGHLFLFFRQPSSKNFLQLLKPEAESETVCVVDRDGGDRIANISQTLPHPYRSLLESGDSTLGQFLQGIGNVIT